MKHRNFIKNSIMALLPISLGLGVILGVNKKSVEQVEGYSTSSLPTTIYLNDTSASDIRSYYASLDNKTTSERQGNNLLKNLKTILKNGQKYYSYDSGNAIWELYEITDRDWAKSPASSTTYGTYNSSTNTLTNYQYGSGKNNPYIHALYINRNVTNQTRAWGNHNQDQWGINREHVWPKAEGFETSGAGGARGDPMHLMAGNGYVNNIHSNYYYGYVKTSSSYTDCGNKYSNQSGNLKGTPVNANSGTVFEPQDCDKGDIARAIFYMVARYNYLGGSDTIDSNNPNLELTQDISKWESSGYVSTTSKTGKMGLLTDLLNWHHQDPVDEYEIHRNNLLYKNFTNNRNPFIDFPEWVDFIWGTATYNGKTKQTYSSTPTGYATPSSDTINGYNSGSGTAVAGVSLNKNSTSLVVGGSENLTATITPEGATNKSVTWSSSNNNVAIVSSSGKVTAVASGSATITVTTSDGGFTATCSVSVSNPSKTLSSISITGATTSFKVGDAFSFGGTLTAHFSDSSSSDVTSSADFTGYNLSNIGEQTVTVSYSYGGTTKTTTYTIEVSDAGSGSISFYRDDTTNTVTSGYSFVNSLSSGKSGYYQDKSSTEGLEIGIKKDNSGEIWSTSPTSIALTVKVGGGSAKNPLENNVIAYFIDSSGTIISSSETVVTTLVEAQAGTDFTVHMPSTNDVAGVLITHEKESNYNIRIYSFSLDYSFSKSVSSFVVKTPPMKLAYIAGEDFAPEGLVITATYSDSSTADVSYADNEDSFEFDPADNLQTSDISVTISYGGKTCNQAITVNPDTSPSISLNTYQISAYTGQEFSVTATFDNLTSDFAWGSVGDADLSGTISSTGTARAGTSTYTFTCVGAGSKTLLAQGGGYDPQQCLITVTQTTVSINKDTTSIDAGSSETLTATCNVGSVNWTSSNDSVASVNSSGVVSVPANATIGATATITATSDVDSSVSATCTITVKEPQRYTLITNASQLSAGLQFILIHEEEDSIAISSYTPSYFTTVTTASVSDNKAVCSGAMVFTLEGSSGAWKIKSADKYYGLTSSSNATVGQNSSSTASGYSWTISISSNVATMTTDASGERYLGYNSSASPKRFAAYKDYKKVRIFAIVSELSSVTTAGQTTSFSQGSKFSYGGTLTAHYTGSKADATVTPAYFKYGSSGIDPTTSGTTITTNTNMSRASHDGKYIYVVYTEGGITKHTSYQITVSSDPSLTWSAPIINVYSGTSLSSESANSWGVTYNNGSGSITYPTYGQFSVKLGGVTISLPYNWQPGDDGKTLCVFYNDLTTSTTTVSVVQTLQAVNASLPGEPTTSSLTFTEKYSTGGATSDGSEQWVVESDAASGESNFDGTKGIHYGTGTEGTGEVGYLTLSTSDFGSGKITSIVVNASTASGVSATVGVTVGGEQFGGAPQSLSSTATNYTFTGEVDAGEIIVRIAKPSVAIKALYCKSIVVTYTPGGESTNIANVSGHEDAQRAVVKFAKAFNTAMGTTNYCTTNMSTAWSSATSAWNTFLSEAAALGETEEAYAKNLIKYATAQYTDGTDSDYSYCLERAMATYEKCVKSHGQTAFMSAVRPVSANTNINPILVFGVKASSGIAVIIIVSVISVTAIGGYFFMKSKRKEDF